MMDGLINVIAKTKYGITLCCLTGLLFGCSAPSPDVIASPAASPSPAISTDATIDAIATTADRQTYDEPSMAIVAQYPKNMTVDANCSSEGCGYFFKFKPQSNALDEAEVHVFLPTGVATAAEQAPFVTGANGLMQNNGWKVDSTQADGAADFPYSWVETIINFSTDQEQSGHILLGQTNGQAVQVTLLYPSEMSSAYWPAAKTILKSLSFKADRLPLKRSAEASFPGEDPATMCDPKKEPC